MPKRSAARCPSPDRVPSMWKPSAPDQPQRPRRIGSILGGTGPAGALAAGARRLLRVERTVHRILGGESEPHVRAAGSAPHSLTLLADSPAWASIARFKVPDLRAALRPELPHLRRIRVAVEAWAPARPRRPAEEPRTLSPGAARTLRTAARTVDHPRLARVLVRLAAREREPPPAASGGPARSGLNPPWPDGHR